MGTWAAYVGFTQIAETIDGDITAESFYEAASNTSALDLNGMVPVLDFTQEWTDGLDGLQAAVQPQRRVQPARERQGRPADDRVRGRRRPGVAAGLIRTDLVSGTRCDRAVSACETRCLAPMSRLRDGSIACRSSTRARTAFLSGLPTGVSRQRVDVVDRLG